ncbi:MAG: DUF2933 domain-containing protein [Burkholderiaceae bacterium]|nr:DUF2933 domain-containing protein [Burkholderiaceae bacterium]
MHTEHHQQSTSTPTNGLSRRLLLSAAVMAALIGTFYLLREHWGHLAGNWAYLLLLACPVMHLFHGHGGHAHHADHGPDADRTTNKAE